MDILNKCFWPKCEFEEVVWLSHFIKISMKKGRNVMNAVRCKNCGTIEEVGTNLPEKERVIE